jgi:hypothetical protein
VLNKYTGKISNPPKATVRRVGSWNTRIEATAGVIDKLFASRFHPVSKARSTEEFPTDGVPEV